MDNPPTDWVRRKQASALVKNLAKPPRERTIEQYLVAKVKAIGGRLYKFTSSVNGVPDRIVLYKGKTWFIEVKRPGESPTALQRKIHDDMRAQGAKVWTVSDHGEVDLVIDVLTDPS